MSDTNFKNIKVIGFDLDQTLYPKSPEIDSAIQEYIHKKIASRLNVDLTAAKNKFRELYRDGQGLSGRKTLLELGFPEEEASEIVQEALENADIAKFLKPNPKVKSALEKLKEKYALDILTGSSYKIASQKLASLQIDSSLFNNLITDESGSKHDGSAYKLWFSKYPQLSHEQFLYIGDRPKTDYETPSKLGINCILVNMKEPDNSYLCLQLKDILEIETFLL